MRAKILAAMVSATLTMAGCSSTATKAGPTVTTASSSSHATPSSSPSSAPPLWTLAVARQMYLSDVKPANALAAKYPQIPRDLSLKRLHGICQEVAASDAALARKLAAGRWPIAVQKHIDAQVVGLTKERAGWSDCAAASSVDDANASLDHLYDPSPLSEQTRIALGLPSTK